MPPPGAISGILQKKATSVDLSNSRLSRKSLIENGWEFREKGEGGSKIAKVSKKGASCPQLKCLEMFISSRTNLELTGLLAFLLVSLCVSKHAFAPTSLIV